MPLAAWRCKWAPKDREPIVRVVLSQDELSARHTFLKHTPELDLRGSNQRKPVVKQVRAVPVRAWEYGWSGQSWMCMAQNEVEVQVLARANLGGAEAQWWREVDPVYWLESLTQEELEAHAFYAWGFPDRRHHNVQSRSRGWALRQRPLWRVLPNVANRHSSQAMVARQKRKGMQKLSLRLSLLYALRLAMDYDWAALWCGGLHGYVYDRQQAAKHRGNHAANG